MKPIFKEFFRSLAFGVIIFTVLLLFALASGRTIGWDISLFINFLYVMLYTVTLHLANALIFMGMDRLFEGGGMTVKRLFTGFGASMVVSMLIIFLLRIFEDVAMEGKTLTEFFETETIANYYLAMVISLVISFSIHAFYFYKSYQENKVKEQKIIAGTASAKFESLKNQIDPHFLFNSLNVLSSLIEENPESAQRFTTSLSKVYRYVLEQKDKELVSVQEELQFAKTYMNLLKMRFENSIFYEVDDTTLNPEAKVVPLSLQLLLENTIKHNVVSQQKPLYIRIFEESGYLAVQNGYQKKEVLQDRKGVGLQNIVNRYAIISSRKVIVAQTEEYFTVKLPILTKQVTVMETTYTEKEESYYKAQKRVEDIKGFYSHAFSYVIVIAGLMVLNLIASPKHLWFLYPAAGWGIGLIIHSIYVFNFMPFFGREWEENKIREILEKQNSERWK